MNSELKSEDPFGFVLPHCEVLSIHWANNVVFSHFRSSRAFPGVAAESGEQVETEDKKSKQGENAREHEKKEVALPLEVPKEELPDDLALVLARMQAGTLQRQQPH